jgi:TPR repeat protein
VAIAQTNVGVKYEKGRGGVRQDYVEAVKWYLKAADQGEAVGQVNLGLMYDRGYGVGGIIPRR